MSSSLPPVILMRGNDICFLGMLRSCRKAEISTVSITFTWSGAKPWYSSYSNCLEECFEITNPFSSPDEAAKQLAKVLRSLNERYGQKLLLLPSSDTNYMFVLDHWQLFADYIFLMGDESFEVPRFDVLHKGDCADLLMRGCPELVPQTFSCKERNDIPSIVARIGYPAIYKPAVKDYGQSFYANHRGSKAVECANADDLRAKLELEIEAGFELVVQEKVLFDTVHDEVPFYLYADARGEILMASNGIKEVIEPFPFGTAILLRLAWYPELLEAAKTVVNALSYRGILMIEFVRDQRDGNWKVIEVNPRHWLFNGFYAQQGLSYTATLAKDIRGEVSSSLIVPNESVLGKVHVDLVAWAHRAWRNEHSLRIDQYLDTLSSLQGQISDPYCLSFDHAPGQMVLESLAERFGWGRRSVNSIRNLLDESWR